MTVTSERSTSHTSDLDIFSDEFLMDPYPHYQALREKSGATYFPQYDLWGLYRYDSVRTAIHDWERFTSTHGVSFNAMANELYANSVMHFDPPEHAKIRKVFDDALRPKFIRRMAGDIRARADHLVDEVLAAGEIDGVADFARRLPVDIVMDLVGFPRDETRDKILEWAAGSLMFMGPAGEKQLGAIPAAEAEFEYLLHHAGPDNLLEDSFGQVVYAAADRGEISHEEAVTMMIGYMNAGLDTTIHATGNTLWLLARHPDQWDLLKSDPTLVPSAFLEGVRVESPLANFGRVTTCDVDMDGTVIPANSRVLMSYGAANRDGSHYPDPDTFDITRNPVDLLAFDGGVHTCPGRTLASMEGHALFSALARKVDTIELIGEPVREINYMTRGLSSLPVRLS